MASNLVAGPQAATAKLLSMIAWQITETAGATRPRPRWMPLARRFCQPPPPPTPPTGAPSLSRRPVSLRAIVSRAFPKIAQLDSREVITADFGDETRATCLEPSPDSPATFVRSLHLLCGFSELNPRPP